MQKKLVALLVVISAIFSCSPNKKVQETYAVIVNEDGKYGYIDHSGKVVINCRFDDAQKFKDGLAGIKIDSLWGFIDTTGNVVIEPKYVMVHPFSEGLSRVVVSKGSDYPGGQEAFVDSKGKQITGFFQKIKGDFSDGRAIVFNEGKWSVINKNGELDNLSTLPYYSYWSNSYHSGIIRVTSPSNDHLSKQKELSYVDLKGNKIFSTSVNISSEDQPDDFFEDLARVPTPEGTYYINTKGTKEIQNLPKANKYGNFLNRLAWFTTPENKYGFINKSGKIQIPPQYDKVHDFGGDYSICKKEGKWFIIDQSGHEQLIDFVTDVEKGFDKELAFVQLKDRKAYIDTKGKIVWNGPVEATNQNFTLQILNSFDLKLFIPFPYVGFRDSLLFQDEGDRKNTLLARYVDKKRQARFLEIEAFSIDSFASELDNYKHLRATATLPSRNLALCDTCHISNTFVNYHKYYRASYTMGKNGMRYSIYGIVNNKMLSISLTDTSAYEKQELSSMADKVFNSIIVRNQ